MPCFRYSHVICFVMAGVLAMIRSDESCDFDRNTCGWKTQDNAAMSWTRVCSLACLSGHGNHYMELDMARANVYNKGWLYSPWINGSASQLCQVDFKYFVSGNSACQLSVMLKTYTSLTTLWSSAGNETHWTSYRGNFSCPRHRYRIIVEGKKISNLLCEKLKIDDVQLQQILLSASLASTTLVHSASIASTTLIHSASLASTTLIHSASLASTTLIHSASIASTTLVHSATLASTTLTLKTTAAGNNMTTINKDLAPGSLAAIIAVLVIFVAIVLVIVVVCNLHRLAPQKNNPFQRRAGPKIRRSSEVLRIPNTETSPSGFGQSSGTSEVPVATPEINTGRPKFRHPYENLAVGKNGQNNQSDKGTIFSVSHCNVLSPKDLQHMPSSALSGDISNARKEKTMDQQAGFVYEYAVVLSGDNFRQSGHGQPFNARQEFTEKPQHCLSEHDQIQDNGAIYSLARHNNITTPADAVAIYSLAGAGMYSLAGATDGRAAVNEGIIETSLSSSSHPEDFYRKLDIKGRPKEFVNAGSKLTEEPQHRLSEQDNDAVYSLARHINVTRPTDATGIYSLAGAGIYSLAGAADGIAIVNETSLSSHSQPGNFYRKMDIKGTSKEFDDVPAKHYNHLNDPACAGTEYSTLGQVEKRRDEARLLAAKEYSHTWTD